MRTGRQLSKKETCPRLLDGNGGGGGGGEQIVMNVQDTVTELDLSTSP